jgi:hypothetical protein
MKAASHWVRENAGGATPSGAETDLADTEKRLGDLKRGLTESLAAAVRAGAAPDVIDAVTKGATGEITVLQKRAARLRAALAQSPPDNDWAMAMARATIAIAKRLGKQPDPETLRGPLGALGVRVIPDEPGMRPALRVECTPDVAALLAIAGAAAGDSEEAAPPLAAC